MLADTSGLLAYFDSGDPNHNAVAKEVDAHTGRLVVSPFVLAELDYLVATRVGVGAELAVLSQFSIGAFDIAPVTESAIADAAKVIRKYEDLEIGLADAHQVVLANELRTRSILTLDRRHFGVLRPLQGGRFQIRP